MARVKKQPQTVQTAAIYARYSSSAQNDASIEQQVEECTRYAAMNGLIVVSTYEDRAMTGRNDRRPGFQRMIRAAERGVFQTLLTYKSNRLARNMLDALKYEDRLDKVGVSVVYCKEDFGDNAAGRLALRMMMSINEFYSDNLAEDVKRGMLDSAKKCKVVGVIPFGYKKGADDRLEIDGSTAPIVLEIFQRTLNGETASSIARDLNTRGIQTAQHKPWGKGSFHGILNNERYVGVYLYKDMRIEGGVPAIVSREVYDAVQEVRKMRNPFTGRHRSNNDFLLTGKLFCGKCLSPMVGISGKGRHGDVHYYYSCNGKRLDKICDKKTVRKDQIEEEGTRCILTVVLKDEMLEWIADAIMDMANTQREKSKLSYYESRLSETKKQITNIVRAVEMGVVADEFKDRMAQLQEDKQTLQGKIAIEKMNLLQVDREHVVHYLHTIRDGDPVDPAFQRRIIRDFVRAVYLYDGYFKLVADFTGKNVTYEMPISTGESCTDSPPIDDAPAGLYSGTFAPPSCPYTNPCSAKVLCKGISISSTCPDTIEVTGQAFVITWYFKD